jgi:predicted acylesterase/phospholipase RssA
MSDQIRFCRRRLSRAPQFAIRLALLATFALATGCAAFTPRNVLSQAEANQTQIAGFSNIRFWGDSSAKEIGNTLNMEPRGAEARLALAGEDHQPMSNLLAISGGAEKGAFGAGLLVGWSDAGNRPVFDQVTGVSSGALIAPFAFLGHDRDGQLREIFTSYGRQDIFTYDVPSLLEGAALVDNSPLAKLIEKYVDDDMIREIAKERRKGRLLLIGTTNLDTQRPVLWDMGRIAISSNPEAKALFRKILLASSALPGIFPPVRIQVKVGQQSYDELHVDGGLTRQVFIAPPAFASTSRNQVSGSAIKPRLYVIRNGRIDPEWQPVKENMFSITQRSISTLIKNQGIGDLYRIYSEARRDGIDFNLASIPSDVSETSNKPFDQNYMASLFDRGYALASQHYMWSKGPPGFESFKQSRN